MSNAVVAAPQRGGIGDLRASTLLLLLILGSLLIGGATTLMRLFVGWEWVANYNKLVNPVLVGIAALVLLRRRPLRLDPFLLVLILVVPFGVLVGLVRGGSPRYFLAHAFIFAFAGILYAAARSQGWSPDDLRRFVETASAVILTTYILAEGIFWGFLSLIGSRLYFGISTGDLLLPFSYYLLRRRAGLAALSALLIVGGGNRGAVVALLVVSVAALPLPGRSRLGLRLLLGMVCVAVLLGLSFAADPYVRSLDLPPAIDRLWSKWMILNPLRPDFDPHLASAGRYEEMSYAYEAFRELPGAWLVGAGYGWSYVNYGELWHKEDSQSYVAHYVHMSPMNYLLLYGLPMALLLLGAIWWSASRSYRWSLVEMGPRSVEYALALYVIGTLVWGLTIYTWSVNPMLWVIMGALAGRATGGAEPAKSR